MNAIKPNVSVPTLMASTLLSANSPQPSGQTSDFEKTLRDTSDKPLRKNAAHKPDADKSGDQLPDAGNNPPVAAAPPPAQPAPLAQTVTSFAGDQAAAAANGSRAADGVAFCGKTLDAAAPAAKPQIAAAPVDGPSAALTAAGDVAAATPAAPPTVAADDGSAAAPPAPAPPAPIATVTAPPKAPPVLPVAASPAAIAAPPAATDGTTPIKNSTLSTAAALPAAALPAAGASNSSTVKAPLPPSSTHGAPVTQAAGVHAAVKPAVAADTADSRSANANAAAGSAAAADGGVDATAQTQLASAMAAAAAGVVAPATQAAASTDSLATPATGATPAGTAAITAMTAVAGTAASQPASAAAAATAAQVVIGATDASATDKHGHTATADLASTAGTDGAAGFAQLLGNAPGTDAAPATLKVTAGVDTPEFAQGVGNQVSVMLDNNLNTAKLQVNPGSLGPIEVRIAIQNGHAQVWMTSHSAVTRDALESSTAKLKEMLGSQGFTQVSVDISQRSFQERSPQPQTYAWQPPAVRESSPASSQAGAASTPRSGSGVLDAYA